MLNSLLVLASRIRGLLFKRSLDADFDQELQSHIAMLTEEHVRRGMTPAEARRQAHLKLGGVSQIEEHQRDHRGLPQIETTLGDIRYALRTLRKSPGFTLVAVLTLAIGIGATTAMFSVVDAVLLRPLPYPQSGRLIEITETNPLKGWTHTVAAPANFADWQKLNSVFTGIAAYNGSDGRGASQFDMFLTGEGETQRLKGLAVTANLFDVLGVRPWLGRNFTEEENFEGKDRVVILSYNLWQTAFAGDPRIVGRTISLSGRTYDVLGIMPRDFFFPSHDIQIFTTVGFKPSVFTEMRRPHMLNVVARLRDGVSLVQARSQMTAIARRLEQMYPDTNTQMGVRLEGFHASLSQDSRLPLLMLLGAVGFLFLIVCSNIANLQLGRATARSREITIRQALGASRGRLIRQLLTESLVLSLAGGAIGLALAAATGSVLTRFAADALPLYADLRMNGWILLFNGALTVLAPVLFGVMPALASLRAGNLSDRSRTASPRSQSTRDILVACEVALSLMLVIGSGLLIRSLIRLQNVDPGFNQEHTVTFNLLLPGGRYPEKEQVARAIQQIEARLHAEPQVQAAGATSMLALRGAWWTGDASVEGRSPDDFERELRHKSVTPDYFRAMGMRLLRGRFLDNFDKPPRATVVLVNETLGKKYFRGEDPVGKRIRFGRPWEDWVTIVGVVADEKQDGMAEPVQPEVYVTLGQQPSNRITFVVRGSGDADSLVAAARRQVQIVDKDLALTDVITLRELVRDAVGDERFRTSLLSGFAVVALFLAALGIYGVLAYSVTQRAREIGIRLALGAPQAGLFGMVVRQGMRPVVLGSIAGLAGAYALTGLMKTLLFGVTPADPPTYVATTVILATVALCACAAPALRAVRVDPLVALRED